MQARGVMQLHLNQTTQFCTHGAAASMVNHLAGATFFDCVDGWLCAFIPVRFAGDKGKLIVFAT